MTWRLSNFTAPVFGSMRNNSGGNLERRSEGFYPERFLAGSLPSVNNMGTKEYYELIEGVKYLLSRFSES